MPKPDTRYGHQPILVVLLSRGIKYAQLARESGIEYNHLANVITGRTAVSKQCLQILPDALGLPVEELFTQRSIDDGGYSSKVALRQSVQS
ncbi:helix-turn-helix domain-containing protein [Rhodococcus pyridinivorans]|uniref:helix-turn-helix domain-containing protein n=1 Tax=Rhodococcus pyridinivorans TaxID=103816 RepID=UPI0020C67894|nr:helix-turn-helix domain-containing protein [Rhodococcus pyridinivorans]UTM37637.1 helix-turn-helix domain-containing protein [Rhodococcus pyridinivorans]